MTKTKIEWCDYTWNPVTGCLHNCEYCYARWIANRFGGRWIQNKGENIKQDDGELHPLGEPYLFERKNGDLCNAAFPYGFSPTLHYYRFDEPAKIKKPQSIFVCSMADLFGEWVPDEWINAVFEACKRAPQHRYFFLTKNPNRYTSFFLKKEFPNNFWFGTTVTNTKAQFIWSEVYNTFLSIEPIQEEFKKIGSVIDNKSLNWIIIGSETGNRKEKVRPKKEWIEYLVSECRRTNTAVFIKNNLREIWNEPLIQEYPWTTAEAIR